MGKILFALALNLPVLATAQAIASERTDAMAPVHQFIDGFNKGDMKSAIAACADEASVIDDSLRTSGKVRAPAKNGRMASTQSLRRTASPMRGSFSASLSMST